MYPILAGVNTKGELTSAGSNDPKLKLGSSDGVKEGWELIEYLNRCTVLLYRMKLFSSHQTTGQSPVSMATWLSTMQAVAFSWQHSLSSPNATFGPPPGVDDTRQSQTGPLFKNAIVKMKNFMGSLEMVFFFCEMSQKLLAGLPRDWSPENKF